MFYDNWNITDDFIVFKTVDTPVYICNPWKALKENGIFSFEGFNFFKSSECKLCQRLIFEESSQVFTV